MSGVAALACVAAAIWSPPTEAAGRRPYGGLIRVAVPQLGADGDPQAARTAQDRWLVSWLHCGLFRLDRRGRPAAELARGPGRWARGTLTLKLTDGATFRDDTPVVSADVAASIRTLGRRTADAPLALLAGALDVETPDPTTIVIRPPRGVKARAVRRLLARPELAVLPGGRPGAGGCGAFRVSRREADGLWLEPADGTPRGLPWLSGVQVVALPRATDAAQALVFDDVDVAGRPSPRFRRFQRLETQGWSTVFAVPGTSLSGDGARDARRSIFGLAAAANLPRYVDWPAEAAASPWPGKLAATERVTTPPLSIPRLARLIVAYPEEAEDLAELARALRDVLGGLATGEARVLPVSGLDAVTARAAGANWDLALVRHDWGAVDRGQAAAELAFALGVTPPEAHDALRGRLKAWGERIVDEALALPVIHYHRPVFHRAGWKLRAGGAGVLDLSQSWRE